MLYLHGGLPRTGTTSLQGALAECEGRLSEIGVIYPTKLRPPRAPTHHEFQGLLRSLRDSDAELTDFKQFLARHADNDVLFSAEGLIGWLEPGEKLDALLTLLTAASEVVPTKFVWTLRRRDEALTSLWLKRSMPSGKPLPPRDGPVDSTPPTALFAGMRIVEDVLEGQVTYVKYCQSGSHNRMLIDVFHIPEPARSELHRRLHYSPRLNVGPSQKQVIALLNVEKIAQETGVDLDAAALRKAYSDGELVFDVDRPCDLIDADRRRRLHEAALEAAEQEGFAPYADFFADAQIPDHRAVSLDAEVLDEADLQRLVAIGEVSLHWVPE